MGDLVQGRFEPKRIVVSTLHGTQTVVSTRNGFGIPELLFGYDEARAQRDLQFVKDNDSFIESVCARAEEMRAAVFDKIDPSVYVCHIEKQRIDIRKMSLDLLCREILLSECAQWSTKASLYGAYALELAARLYQATLFAMDNS